MLVKCEVFGGEEDIGGKSNGISLLPADYGDAVVLRTVLLRVGEIIHVMPADFLKPVTTRRHI